MSNTEVILPDYDEMMERLDLVSDSDIRTKAAFRLICRELGGKSLTPVEVVAKLEHAFSRYCEEWHQPPLIWGDVKSSFQQYLRVLISDDQLRQQARQYFELAA